MAHIYPSALQALAGRGRTERLEGEFHGYLGGAMQDLGYELPRIYIPRTRVNKGIRKGRGSYVPALDLDVLRSSLWSRPPVGPLSPCNEAHLIRTVGVHHPDVALEGAKRIPIEDDLSSVG
jgi:hypothetical protein